MDFILKQCFCSLLFLLKGHGKETNFSIFFNWFGKKCSSRQLSANDTESFLLKSVYSRWLPVSVIRVRDLPYHRYGELVTLRITDAVSLSRWLPISLTGDSPFHRYTESSTSHIVEKGESIFDYEYLREFEANIMYLWRTNRSHCNVPLVNKGGGGSPLKNQLERKSRFEEQKSPYGGRRFKPFLTYLYSLVMHCYNLFRVWSWTPDTSTLSKKGTVNKKMAF
jgi:hypothetical protein